MLDSLPRDFLCYALVPRSISEVHYNRGRFSSSIWTLSTVVNLCFKTMSTKFVSLQNFAFCLYKVFYRKASQQRHTKRNIKNAVMIIFQRRSDVSEELLVVRWLCFSHDYDLPRCLRSTRCSALEWQNNLNLCVHVSFYSLTFQLDRSAP